MKPNRINLSLLVLCTSMVGCRAREVCLLNEAKIIPVTGGTDVFYAERSEFWDEGERRARSTSNRQIFSFSPPSGMALYVTLENMGGVPMRRDTFRAKQYRFAELYLRTATRDTNLQIHIETNDKTRPPTDVTVYMRNTDSVFSLIRFEGLK